MPSISKSHVHSLLAPPGAYFDYSGEINFLLIHKLKRRKVYVLSIPSTYYLRKVVIPSFVCIDTQHLHIQPTSHSMPWGYKTFFMLNSADHEILMLINVKMPVINGILTFISMINTTAERLQERHFFICRYLGFMSS